MAEHRSHPSAELRLEDLRAQARYARQRYDLYKARAYGQRPTSDTRMRELQRACEQAAARLGAAEAERGDAQPPGDPPSPS
jgi:hypothetical protein